MGFQFRGSQSYRLDILFISSISTISKTEADNVAHMRNVGAKWAREHLNPSLLFFADDDTQIPSEDFFDNLILHHLQRPSVAGLAGPYLTPSGSRALDLAYNWICNAWMTRWPGLFLAGNLSLKSSHLPESLMQKGLYPTDVHFGGEEWGLFETLLQHKLSVSQVVQLGVFHRPQCTLGNFVKRAWRNSKRRKNSNLQKLQPVSWKVWSKNNAELNQWILQIGKQKVIVGNEKRMRLSLAIFIYAFVTLAGRKFQN